MESSTGHYADEIDYFGRYDEVCLSADTRSITGEVDIGGLGGAVVVVGVFLLIDYVSDKIDQIKGREEFREIQFTNLSDTLPEITIETQQSETDSVYRYSPHKKGAKLFNGYVVEPIPIVFVAIIPAIGLIVLAFCGMLEFALDGNISTNTEKGVIASCYAEDSRLFLTTETGHQFSLYKGAIESEGIIWELINDEEPVLIRYKYDENKKTGSYRIVEITVGSETIVTRKAEQAAYKKAAEKSNLILCMVSVVYNTFIGVAYYIVSNAPRYPRLAALFIRKEFRNF